MPFAKLFCSILDSTVWCEDPATKVVWITLLAMADRNGSVMSSLPGLAKRAGVGLEDAKAAVEKFMAPDPYSRNKSNEGRRLVEIEGGWNVINYPEFRKMRDEVERREYLRDYMRERRHRPRKQVNQESTSVSPSEPQLSQADAEAEAEKSKPLLKQTAFERFWESYPRKISRKAAQRAWLTAAKKALAVDILSGLSLWVDYWRGKDGQFVPYPATWLNQERWNDAPEPANGQASAGANAQTEFSDEQRSRMAERVWRPKWTRNPHDPSIPPEWRKKFESEAQP